MAKPTELSNEQREIIRAQNDALVRLPADRDARIALIHGYRLEKAKENDLIAQAKKDVGSNETFKKLTSAYGYKPQAIKFINVLSEMAATDRSAALRQVMNHGEDQGWIIPDLFDAGAIGVGANDEAGETAGFDKTSEGQRRGGSKAEPRSTEQMAASHEPAPTPGLDLSTPEARAAVIKQYEDYNAANPPKRGPVPKAAKELKAAAEKAREIEAQGVVEPGADEATAVGEAAFETEKLSNVFPISQQIREGNAAAEEHLRKATGRAAAEEPAQQAQETVEEPAKPKAPRKPRKAKETPAEAAPPAPPAEDEPPAPPADDDDEDEGFPDTRPVHRGVGDQPSSYTVG